MDLEMDTSALVARLDKVRAGVAMDGKKKALRAGGKVIRDAIRARTPILKKKTAQSTSLEPGALQAGIRTYVHEEDGQLEALIGPAKTVEHVARWVEFGHRSVKGGYSKVLANGKTKGPGKAGIDVPAYPFLRPGFEESEESALLAVNASLNKTIEELGV